MEFDDNHRNNTTSKTNIWSRTSRVEQDSCVSPHQGLLVTFQLFAWTQGTKQSGMNYCVEISFREIIHCFETGQVLVHFIGHVDCMSNYLV